ncbi:MAG: hypothetical protein IJT68_09285 [Lentisphaeria bacterium]|nr:hypothetical protein [Lentisphaeria bacterium]MBR3506370.1 hypothetical protein [Lentisphaeria bacterium]
MSEFLQSCFGGTYPHYALIAFAVILYRLTSDLRTRSESLLLFLFLAFYIGTIAQIVIADHTLYVSRRYLIPFAPLLFGYTAIGVLRFKDRIRCPALFGLLTVLVVLTLLWDATGPIVKEYYTSKRIALNASNRDIAEFIRADFKGAKTRGELPVWWYEPRSPARPVLKDAPFQLSYMVGGTYWNAFFPDDPVDYLLVPAGEGADAAPVPDGFVQVFETDLYRVFRSVDPGGTVLDVSAGGGEAPE